MSTMNSSQAVLEWFFQPGSTASNAPNLESKSLNILKEGADCLVAEATRAGIDTADFASAANALANANGTLTLFVVELQNMLIKVSGNSVGVECAEVLILDLAKLAKKSRLIEFRHQVSNLIATFNSLRQAV